MTPETQSRVRSALLAVVVVAGVSMVLQGFQRRRAERSGPAVSAVSEVLSQSYPSPDGSFAIHYPADFAAKAIAPSILQLSRNLPDGNFEMLNFAAIARPISQDPGEFTRVAGVRESKKPADWEYQEISKTSSRCNGAPGLEIVSTWRPADTTTRSKRWWCAFMRDGRGYIFEYNTPVTVAGENEPLLRAIVGATTFEGARDR